LAALRVIAHDDPPGSAIRFGFGNCGVEDRDFREIAVKLCAGDRGQIRLDRKTIRRGQPGFVVIECVVFPRPYEKSIGLRV